MFSDSKANILHSHVSVLFPSHNRGMLILLALITILVNEREKKKGFALSLACKNQWLPVSLHFPATQVKKAKKVEHEVELMEIFGPNFIIIVAECNTAIHIELQQRIS